MPVGSRVESGNSTDKSRGREMLDPKVKDIS